MNKSLPKDYATLYKSLVNMKISFPEELYLHEPMLAKIMTDPDQAIRSSPVINTIQSGQTSPVRQSVPPLNLSGAIETRDVPPGLMRALEEISNTREIIADRVLAAPDHLGKYNV